MSGPQELLSHTNKGSACQYQSVHFKANREIKSKEQGQVIRLHVCCWIPSSPPHTPPPEAPPPVPILATSQSHTEIKRGAPLPLVSPSAL